MWKIFFIAAFSFTFVSSQCLDTTATSRARSNSQCSWYNSNSCCEQGDISSFTSNPFNLECGEPTKGCSERLVALLCGMSCSPSWGSYMNATSKRPVVCHDFAYQTWYDCRQNSIKTQRIVGNIILGGCHTISDKYSNEYDFFVNGFEMDVAPRNQGKNKCFNGASSFSVNLLFTILLLSIATLL
eukprot:TRINITY_DN2407_c0_g1_i1.p1 TRINITY_DN2407_c0_g1~~TRINITY_DN2407_c0_g1_i1.p1  ORF type:complete len:185 (+),score=32.92 TRINITY_DN2407_c0_g1_i1:169-723(+)